jgi:hypothetical protein
MASLFLIMGLCPNGALIVGLCPNGTLIMGLCTDGALIVGLVPRWRPYYGPLCPDGDIIMDLSPPPPPNSASLRWHPIIWAFTLLVPSISGFYPWHPLLCPLLWLTVFSCGALYSRLVSIICDCSRSRQQNYFVEYVCGARCVRFRPNSQQIAIKKNMTWNFWISNVGAMVFQAHLEHSSRKKSLLILSRKNWIKWLFDNAGYIQVLEIHKSYSLHFVLKPCWGLAAVPTPTQCLSPVWVFQRSGSPVDTHPGRREGGVGNAACEPYSAVSNSAAD